MSGTFRNTQPLDVAIPRPPQDRHTGQFSAVIADHHGWLGQALENCEIELAGNAHTRDRGVGDERQALPAVVIDQGEDPEPTSADKRVRHEVEAPALVRPLRDRHGCPRAQCPLATTASAHLQALLAIAQAAAVLGALPKAEPLELLVVHRPSFPAQQPVQSAIAEPAALPRQLADAGSCLGIIRPPADIAHRRSIHAQSLAGPALAHFENLLEMSHRLPLGARR